jgi:iron complex outermembrane receptor protein
MRDPVRCSALFVIACSVSLSVFGASEAGAQKGTVRGLVSDSTGRPVQGADVAIVGLRKLTRTDEYGRFALRKLPRGEAELSVRHLGYTPATLMVMVTGDAVDSVRIALIAQVAVLPGIEVSATELQKRLWIEEFHRRRSRGIGTFVTRDQILARNTSRPSDMFRTTPGVRIQRGRGLRVNYSTSINPNRDCPPVLWLDGQRAPGMELDDLPLSDIEGIELYHGPSTTPTQFSQSLSGGVSCGTVVVWSRPPNSRTP